MLPGSTSWWSCSGETTNLSRTQRWTEPARSSSTSWWSSLIERLLKLPNTIALQHSNGGTQDQQLLQDKQRTAQETTYSSTMSARFREQTRSSSTSLWIQLFLTSFIRAAKVDCCITKAPDQLKACLGWGEVVEIRKGRWWWHNSITEMFKNCAEDELNVTLVQPDPVFPSLSTSHSFPWAGCSVKSFLRQILKKRK